MQRTSGSLHAAARHLCRKLQLLISGTGNQKPSRRRFNSLPPTVLDHSVNLFHTREGGGGLTKPTARSLITAVASSAFGKMKVFQQHLWSLQAVGTIGKWLFIMTHRQLLIKHQPLLEAKHHQEEPGKNPDKQMEHREQRQPELELEHRCPSIHLCIYPSIHQSIRLSIHPLVHELLHSFIHQSIYLITNHPFIHQSTHSSTHLSIIHTSIHPSNLFIY